MPTAFSFDPDAPDGLVADLDGDGLTLDGLVLEVDTDTAFGVTTDGSTLVVAIQEESAVASLKFPDTGTRYVEDHKGRPAAGQIGYLYSDEATTVIAEAYTDIGGTKGPLLPTDEDGRRYIRTDGYGRQVDYWGPVSGQDHLWIVINGVKSRVDADYNARIDAVETRISAVEGSVGSGTTKSYVDSADSAVATAASTDATTKANAAQAAAVSTAAGDATTKSNAAQAAAIAASAQRAANLSDLGSAATARTNLGVPPTARAITAGTGLTGGGDLTADRTLTVSYGTGSGTAAQGNDSRIVGAAQKASNLSDLASASTARTNLGLGNVNDTSDANKPLSTAATTALTLKVDKIDRLGEKVFPISFSSASNEKADLYFTGATNGVIEVTITGQYATINSTGAITAIYSLSGSSTGTVFESTMTYTVAQGSLPASFGLMPIVWDATNSRWKLTIAHRNTSVNPITVRVSWQQTDAAGATALQSTLAASSVYTTDATVVAAPVAQAASLAAGLQASKQYVLGVYVATDPRWGYVSGTDIGPACNAAIAAMPLSGGTLVIPPMPSGMTNWTTSVRILIKTGVHITGAGRLATHIRGPVEGVFGWSSHLSQWSIKDLRAETDSGHLMTTKGGDFSISQGEIDGCWFVGNDPNASIFNHDSAWDYIKVKVTNTRLDRDPASTVPGWYIRNSIGAANSNIWENLWAQSYNNTLAPFFWVESTSIESYAYDNVFRNIIGEQNRGGLIDLRNNFGAILENVTDWDAVGEYVTDIVRIGKSSAAPLLRSRYATLTNFSRKGGTLGAGVYDINLVPTETARCTVVAAYHSSEPTSGLRINFAGAEQHTIIGAPPVGSVWPSQPTDTGSYYGAKAQFGAGLYIGNSLETSGTGIPEGAVTGSPGDRFYRTDGGRVSTLYVKESGSATNTGWAAYGAKLPPRASLPNARRLLSGHPLAMVVSTVTWAKDNWRFMPLSLDKDTAFSYLGTVASSGATGGTAAMIFALYTLDQYGRPVTRQADYSSYGTIDLTANVGAENLLATAALVIPAGDWALGCAWTGTATTSPVVYSVSGLHPGVANNAVTQQASAWQQSVSGASAPSTASVSATAVAGIAVYGVMA